MNRRLQTHGPWLAVALAAVAVYANSIVNGFAMDDVFIIQINERVHQLSDPSSIWLKPYWPNYGRELGLYRPLAIFGYAVQWAIGGGAAWVFHASNIVLHAGVCVLAFLLLKRLVGAGPALAGALVFAVHPVHTEVVANIVGQAELIAGAATLGACLLYATRPDGAGTGWGRRIGIVAVYAIGLLAKESAIVLPGLLVAIDVAQGRVQRSRAGLRQYAASAFMPMFLLLATAIAYLALRVDVLGSIGGVDAAPALPFLREEPRLPTALRAWPEYVRLLFYPADLSIDYAPGVILPVDGLSPMALLGAGILIVTVMLAVLTPLHPAAGLAAAWFLITIFPVSNLLMPIGVVVAERLLYTPSFAVALIAAHAWRVAVQHRHELRRRAPAFAVAAVVLVLMGTRTWARNPDWKDTIAVLHALVTDHPESYRAQWSNAGLAGAAGNAELRLQYLEFAYRLWPYDTQMITELAPMHISRGNYARAIEMLESSRDALDWVSLTRYQLAIAYIGARRFDDALRETIAADRLGFGRALLLPLYAQAYEGLGRNDLAIGAWHASLRVSAGDVWTYRARLARLLARQPDTRAALAQLDSARIPAADSAGAAVVRALRHAIGRNCYTLAPHATAPSRDGCEDPLAEWRLLVPQPATQNARDSQNASAAPSVSAAGGRPR